MIHFVVIVHVDRVRLCLWTAAINGPILHPPDDIWVWRATVGWYWQGKTEELGEKPVPEPLCSPQIPYWLTQARTSASVTRPILILASLVANMFPSNLISNSLKLLVISVSGLSASSSIPNRIRFGNWICVSLGWEGNHMGSLKTANLIPIHLTP
jgi:hypothetical protein